MVKKLTFLLLLFAVALSSQNMLVNPELSEQNAKGVPKGWWTPCKTLQLTVENGVFTLYSPSDRAIIVQTLPQMVFADGKAYRFTCMVRAEKKATAQVYVEYRYKDEEGKNRTRSIGAAPFEVGPSRREHVLTFPFPENATGGHIVFGSHRKESTVQYKDILLKEANIRKEPFGYWELDSLAEIHPTGIIATRSNPAVLHDIPVIPGKAYSLKYNAVGIGDTGNDYPFHEMVVKTNPSTLQGGYFFNDVKNSPMPKAQKITIPDNFMRKTIDITFNANTKGKILFSDFSFDEFVPDVTESWRIVMEEPFYRDIIYESHDTGRVSGTILATAPAATINAELTGYAKISAKINDGKAEFAIPTPNLPIGDYTLTANILDADGKILKTFTKKLKKVPRAPIEIIPNRNRYLEINGKPFFPVLQWRMDFIDDEDAVYEAARNGINSTKTFPSNNDVKKTLKDLDTLHKFGLMSVLTPSICARNLSPKHLDDIRKLIEKKMPREVREHPAVLGYFLIDEPLWCGRPSAPIRATYEIYKEIDPYKPVWINAAPRNEIEDLRPYAEACDIWGVDIYPIPSPNSHSGLPDKTITSVGKYTIRMNEVTYWRKPIYMALQGFAWASLNPNNPLDSHVYPTTTEMRFMNYDTFLNGGSCGWWGTQHIRSNAFYRSMYASALELHTLSGLLAYGSQQPDLATDNRDVRVVPFIHGTNRYFFVQNMIGKQSNVTFDTGSNDVVTIYLTGQKLQPVDGKVTLTLEPFEPFCHGAVPLPEPTYQITPEDASRKPFAIEKYVDELLKVKNARVPYNGKANWIWHEKLLTVPSSTVMCTHTIELNDLSKKVTLLFTADDFATAFVNGKQVFAEKPQWDLMQEVTINRYLTKGKNSIVIKAWDGREPPCAALLAEIRVDGIPVLATDDSWLIRTSSEKDTDVTSEDGYVPAHIVAPYGGGPWGRKVGILKEGTTSE
ncbi:MAG: hypothetical protein J6X55_00560 [Victivallales bacterium]|nr:hypothetical protein [Victivallales bacterium]